MGTPQNFRIHVLILLLESISSGKNVHENSKK